MHRIVVLASGAGSLLQALIDSPVRPSIAAVGSDVADATALTRASDAGIVTFVVPITADRAAWDEQLADRLVAISPDYVVCAGFMRVLGPSVLGAFPGRIINSHPALLPAFAGAHAVRDALAYGAKVTGCTVHVVDAGIDTGPLIAQQPVIVSDDDDESSLHERIKQVERVLLVDIVQGIVDRGLVVDGRSVSFG
ncbi:MAG: phosphoribosylglycinamide formyltransferase [Candidatus Nanopelagicales bacterium]